MIWRAVKLKLVQNEPGKIRVKCVNVEGYKFVVFISKDGNNPGLAVKTLQPDYDCFRSFEIPSASAKYLENYFKKRIIKNSEIKVKDLQAAAEEEIKLIVSLEKCKRAKKRLFQN